MIRRSFLFIVLALLVVSCSDNGFDPTLVAQGRPIMYGSPDTNPAHDAVVAVTNRQHQYFCSATLIAADVVMTAGHCLDGQSASNVDIFFGSDAYSGVGTYVHTSELAVHPNYDGYNILNDISLARLSSAAPSGVVPIPHLPASLGLTSSDEGKTVEFSGFGLTEDGTDGDKLHVNGVIDTVCGGSGSCGNVVPHAFGYNQASGGPCSGDSGGPAFILRSGTEYVAGVTSYGDQNCTQFGVSTTASEFASWIENFIGGSGTEDCVNGQDDDGDGMTDCDDFDCTYHPNCVGPGACESAVTVSCGDVINATTADGTNVYSTYGCLTDGTEDGPELAYKLDLRSGTEFTVTLQPSGQGDLDLFLLPASGESCSLSDCLDASYNEEPNNETISYQMPAGGAYLVVETWDTATTFQLQIQCDTQVEQCANGIDDDGDRLIDCNDPDCANDSHCQVPAENCSNNIDDDQDGATDCDDTDCINDAACQVPVENCSNNIDDDQDGATDCDDTDCASSMACMTPAENCTNNVDDDQDGATDCDDTDCASNAACQVPAENCTNDIDDDQDGATDCDDSDCADNNACQVPPEDCTNTIDDDQDGATDCDDTDCVNHPSCQAYQENCSNGIDDDHDGALDCEDTDCAGDTACLPPSEDCTNGKDDDHDGIIDCNDPDCSGYYICQNDSGSGGCAEAPMGGLGLLPWLLGLCLLGRRRRTI
ncbi:MAG TPA: trypsin-like serine protease [Myxococcota bacterium]|nr:trypsin-like serine protease [Myxococcota bacterium]